MSTAAVSSPASVPSDVALKAVVSGTQTASEAQRMASPAAAPISTEERSMMDSNVPMSVQIDREKSVRVVVRVPNFARSERGHSPIHHYSYRCRSLMTHPCARAIINLRIHTCTTIRFSIRPSNRTSRRRICASGASTSAGRR